MTLWTSLLFPSLSSLRTGHFSIVPLLSDRYLWWSCQRVSTLKDHLSAQHRSKENRKLFITDFCTRIPHAFLPFTASNMQFKKPDAAQTTCFQHCLPAIYDAEISSKTPLISQRASLCCHGMVKLRKEVVKTAPPTERVQREPTQAAPRTAKPVTRAFQAGSHPCNQQQQEKSNHVGGISSTSGPNQRKVGTIKHFVFLLLRRSCSLGLGV